MGTTQGKATLMATRRQESYRGKGRMREEPLLTWSQETALEKTNPGVSKSKKWLPELAVS